MKQLKKNTYSKPQEYEPIFCLHMGWVAQNDNWKMKSDTKKQKNSVFKMRYICFVNCIPEK